MIDRNRWREELTEWLTPQRREPINLPHAISVGPGWQHLICDLVDRLDALGVSWNLEQVKEKWGRLCFYVEGLNHPRAVVQAIEEAARRSEVTCEDCGRPGELRGDRWKRTLCLPCQEAFQRTRKPWHLKDI